MPTSQPNMNCPSCGAPIDDDRRFDEVYNCEYCGNTAYFTQAISAEGDAEPAKAPVAGILSRFKIGQHGKIRGMDFNIVGMVQVEYPGGYWIEYRLACGEQEYWLQEDEGVYVLFAKREVTEEPPPWETFKAGAQLDNWNGLPRWFIIETGQAKVVGYEGQLPWHPNVGEEYNYIDGLGGGQVIAMEFSGPEQEPSLSIGDPLEYEDIQLSKEDLGGW